MKKLLIIASIALSSMAHAGLSNGESAILGIIIGSHITRPAPREPVYEQRVIVVPAPAPRYDACEGIRDSEVYAYCRGREQMRDSYRYYEYRR